jgi:hypothetical protein
MLSTLMPRRATRLLAAAAALAVAGACNDSTGPDEDHADEVESIRLVVTQGTTSNTFTIAANGTVTPSPLRVPVGTSTLVATMLDAGGAVIADAELADFRLDVPSATGLAFARTGPFAGTLTVTATAGTTVPVALCLFHLEENHCDVGPWPSFSIVVGS